jgi:CHASE2 domain-containing sensor protein
MPGIGVLAVIVIVLIGRLFLEGILSNPLANPCSFESRRYEDVGSYFYAPLMRLKFRSSYPQDKVFVMPLTSGDDPGDIPASAVENPCEGRRFMAGLVDRLDAYGPSVIAIDRYYNDDDRCPESDGANDVLRVSLASSPIFAHIEVPAVVVGRDSGKVSEEQTNKTGGNCLIEKTPLKLDADPLPVGRMRRPVHLGLARLNSDVLRIPLRWWLSAGPDAAHPEQDRSAAGLALAAYSLASGRLSADELAKVDEGQPLQGEPAGLVKLLNDDAHPYAFFPKKAPLQVSPIDLLCADPDGQDFLRRYLLGVHSALQAIPAKAAHPEQKYCKAARPVPNLGGKVVVIGVRDEDVDVHAFPGGEQHGVDLQADYIEALLDNAYIKTAPGWLDWGLTLVLCVLLLGREVMPDYATAKWWVSLLWDVGVIAGVMALSVLVLFVGYFTPTFWLSCSGVVLSEIVTRLFERITHHVRHRRTTHAKHS